MSVKQGGNTIAGASTVDQTYDGTSTNAQSGTAVAGAIVTKADDNAVVKLTGDQTVGGVKQFTSGVIDLFGTSAVNYRGHFDIDKGSNPITTYYGEITFQDKVDGNDSSHRLGTFSTNVASDGWVQTRMVAYRNTSGSASGATISVSMKNDGTINTYAPACSNTNSIVTTTGLSKAINGYVKLGNGIIVQWGDHSTTSAGASTITFPTAFTNNNYSIVVTRVSGTSTTNESGSYYFRGRTTTSVGVYKTNNNTQSMMWIAIGY